MLLDSANHGSNCRSVAVMPVNQASSAMRKAAPELCRQMDNLRVERKRAIERRCYLNSSGQEEEVAAVQQRITEIDAELATLHA